MSAQHQSFQGTPKVPAPGTTRLAIVGLGYVGLPLAVEFGKHLPTVGYDVNAERVEELSEYSDRTLEVTGAQIKAATELRFTSAVRELGGCNVFVITVPTPIDAAKRPDLGPLINACEVVASILVPGSVVIFESTVYPGCTEDVCVPVLERVSGLSFNIDFTCGYSPERINPGDKAHRLSEVVKITSGSTPDAADFIDNLYRKIVLAGTHKAPSIKVAEAAKVIENTQRDLNIALVNDLAILFGKLGINTRDVLAAARTKWNFLHFEPGLVGGHCIGVDPYYLTHKAQQVGHHPQMILAGRRTNDSMGHYVADRVLQLMLGKGVNPVGSRVLLLGLAFKENCRDTRNTRALDIAERLRSFRIDVDVCDPVVPVEHALREHSVSLIDPKAGIYDGVVVAVAHDEFRVWGIDKIRSFCATPHVLFDVKGIFDRDDVDGTL